MSNLGIHTFAKAETAPQAQVCLPDVLVIAQLGSSIKDDSAGFHNIVAL